MTIETFDDARAAVADGMSVAEASRALVDAMTVDERLWCLDGDAPTWAGLEHLGSDGYHRATFLAARVDRVGFPGLAFSDGPRGAVVGNATCFPVSMARGATWDPELEARVGDAMGRELRAAGATLTGAVCVNVLRHPAWGRAQETYGEDPHHVGEMGAALTSGLQRHVMACVKHFACNSMENARFQVDIDVDDVALHEVYLPHFRRIVGEGVASVMSAYNSVNGEWCGQNRGLLTDVLRHEWGFPGFVISDWILGIRDAAKSLRAGLDVEMPYRMVRAQHLEGALADGSITLEDVDRAVERIVGTVLRFDATLSTPPPAADVIGAPEHRALAREVAARSVVLLRNESVDGEPVLPLVPATRIAVLGRLADTVNIGDRGSSDVWDLECRTVLEGVRDRFSDVAHDDGSDVTRAAAVAAGADVAVVVTGYTHVDEGEFIGETDTSTASLFPPADEPEVVASFRRWLDGQAPATRPARLGEGGRGAFGIGGDRSSLRLPAQDVALITAVAEANPRCVVVIQAGSAVVVSDWVHRVPAIVQAWYGGCEAGPALADVLIGDVNPSARLPFSVPADEADLPSFERDATRFTYDRWHGWWHLRRTGRRPRFAFGFGLSYTRFELDAVHILEDDDDAGCVTVAGTVRNIGDRDGADVVQVYAELPDPGAPERLVGFARVGVAARSRADFRVAVPAGKLATRDGDRRCWVAPSGRYRFRVAHDAVDPGTSVTVDL